MPGAGFHTFGQNAAVLSRTMRDKPVVVVKADMVSIFLLLKSRVNSPDRLDYSGQWESTVIDDSFDSREETISSGIRKSQ
jgi:hypothetical protein